MNGSFSRTQFPPGGWAWYQPETNWHAPNPVSNTFDQQVVNIIKHRQANSAITARHQLATDHASVGNELENYTKRRLGIPDPPKTSPPQFSHFGQAAVGVKTLADWLGGSGVPVPQEVAEARANTCLTCPQHGKGDWFSKFTVPAQNFIKRQLEERNNLRLTTAVDAQLEICEACACPLKLKVHVPIAYINQRLPAPVRERLDPRCWILQEKDPSQP